MKDRKGTSLVYGISGSLLNALNCTGAPQEVYRSHNSARKAPCLFRECEERFLRSADVMSYGDQPDAEHVASAA